MQDGGSAPGAANSTYGWVVAKGAITSPFWKARLGASAAVAAGAGQAASQIDSQTAPQKGTGATNTTAGDSFWAGPYTGVFANTAWTLAWNMRASTSGAVGRIRCRIWRSANADGTSATALTGSTQVGSIVTLSTTADTNSSISWTPGSTLTLSNEYLFFQVEWEETTAGSSTSSNVLFRVGTASITTSDFAATLTATTSQTLGALGQTVTAAHRDVYLDRRYLYDSSHITFSNSDLTAARAVSTDSGNNVISTTSRVSDGTAYYFEASFSALGTTGDNVPGVGILNNQITAGFNNIPGRGGYWSGDGCAYKSNGKLYGLEGDTTFGDLGTSGATYTTGDVIGFRIDLMALTPTVWSTTDFSSLVNRDAGGLSAYINNVTVPQGIRGSIAISSGQYFEASPAATDLTVGGIGLANATQSLTASMNTANAIIYSPDGTMIGSSTGSGGATYTGGDFIGVHYTGTQVKFYKNGVLQFTASTLPSGTLYPAVSFGSIWARVTANFAGLAPIRNTFYALPSGATAYGNTLPTGTVYKNGVAQKTFQLPEGNLYATVVLSDNVAPDTVTVNFGATAFTYQPLGTTSWDGSRVLASGPTITVAQTLGALSQTFAGTHSVNATVAQALGGLVQVATDTVLAKATTTQILGILGQAATAAAVDSAVTAQTLGALSQVAAATAPDAITVAQNLGALAQTATASHPDTATATQTLGALVQAATGGVINALTAAQTLGALAQVATASAATARNVVVSQTLGALGQTATDTVLAQATSAQTLGSLSQVTAATDPVAAAASQTLGALAQAATDTVTDAAVVVQTLGALAQAFTGGVVDSAAVAQTLDALVQSATASHAGTVNIAASQTLGALGQALTGVAVDSATVSQSLGALGQTVTATATDTGSVAQTLGAIVQATTGTVLNNAVVSQALGALNQTAAASGTSGFVAAQTLGALVQAITGTVVSHAVVAQSLGALVQATTGGPVVRATAAQTLGALGQTATASIPRLVTVSQVLGALAQTATAQGPGAANFAAAQILGALGQASTATVGDRIVAAQSLGALIQNARARSTPPAHIHLAGRLGAIKAVQGRIGSRIAIRGNLE